LTFHAASDVLHEVLREPSARTLVESLHKVIQKFGNNFYLAF
jgi:predicted SpoU family rRNA methylase